MRLHRMLILPAVTLFLCLPARADDRAPAPPTLDGTQTIPGKARKPGVDVIPSPPTPEAAAIPRDDRDPVKEIRPDADPAPR